MQEFPSHEHCRMKLHFISTMGHSTVPAKAEFQLDYLGPPVRSLNGCSPLGADRLGDGPQPHREADVTQPISQAKPSRKAEIDSF